MANRVPPYSLDLRSRESNTGTEITAVGPTLGSELNEARPNVVSTRNKFQMSGISISYNSIPLNK